MGTKKKSLKGHGRCKKCGGINGFHDITCGLREAMNTLLNRPAEVKTELTWTDIKQRGSAHYKIGDGEVEPIDLIKSLGLLRHFAIASIIKYASRSVGKDVVPDSDINKICHFASMLRFK